MISTTISAFGFPYLCSGTCAGIYLYIPAQDHIIPNACCYQRLSLKQPRSIWGSSGEYGYNHVDLITGPRTPSACTTNTGSPHRGRPYKKSPSVTLHVSVVWGASSRSIHKTVIIWTSPPRKQHKFTMDSEVVIVGSCMTDLIRWAPGQWAEFG